jgi:hypothetical protein
MSSQKLTGMCLPHLQSTLTSTAKSVQNRCVGVTAEHSHLALDLATATLLCCMPDEMLTTSWPPADDYKLAACL